MNKKVNETVKQQRALLKECDTPEDDVRYKALARIEARQQMKECE